MLIYFDMCCLQRPLDDRTQLRVALEAEAVLGVLALCQVGQAKFVSSDALEYEAARNPHPMRKTHAEDVLTKAVTVIRLSEGIERQGAGIPARRFQTA